jgi:ATP-binding cassette, subfamily A (ABC1), member 1
MTITVLDSLADEEPDLKLISSILKPTFIVLFPHYGLGQGFIEMAFLFNMAQIGSFSGRETSYNPFLYKNVGKNLIAMFLQGIFYNILNLLIQYQFFIKPKPIKNVDNILLPRKTNQDDDVLAENLRLDDMNSSIESYSKDSYEKKKEKKLTIDHELLNKEPFIGEHPSDKDYVKLMNLTKVFKKFKNFRMKKHVAVNNLSLGINKGECFGLIGVNGAGEHE